MKKMLLTCDIASNEHAMAALLAKIGPHETILLNLTLDDILAQATEIDTADAAGESTLSAVMGRSTNYGTELLPRLDELDYLCVDARELQSESGREFVRNHLIPWLSEVAGREVALMSWWHERGGVWIER